MSLLLVANASLSLNHVLRFTLLLGQCLSLLFVTIMSLLLATIMSLLLVTVMSLLVCNTNV